MSLLYDPPSGWMYGFPKPYNPNPGEKLKETLIRDGYPASQADFAVKHCRFIGPHKELEELNDGW